MFGWFSSEVPMSWRVGTCRARHVPTAVQLRRCQHLLSPRHLVLVVARPTAPGDEELAWAKPLSFFARRKFQERYLEAPPS